MGRNLPPALLARRLAAAAVAVLALSGGTCVLIGCGLTEAPRHVESIDQSRHDTAAPSGPAAGATISVTPPTQPTRTPGVRIELTDMAAVGSMLAGLVAIWIALTARHKANGVQRSLTQWQSSPREP